MRINLPNVRPPLNGNSGNFTPPVLKRTRSDPNITLNRTVIRRRLPLINNRLRRPRLINGNKLYRTRPLNHLNLNTIPGNSRVPRPLYLLGKIRIFPLSIFRRARHHDPLITTITRSNQGNLRPNRLTNARPPLPYRRLMAALSLPRQSKLGRAIFPSTLDRPHRLLFVGGYPDLGQQKTSTFRERNMSLSNEFLPFGRSSFPFH